MFKVPGLKCRGHRFKSPSDHLAGVCFSVALSSTPWPLL